MPHSECTPSVRESRQSACLHPKNWLARRCEARLLTQCAASSAPSPPCAHARIDSRSGANSPSASSSPSGDAYCRRLYAPSRHPARTHTRTQAHAHASASFESLRDAVRGGAPAHLCAARAQCGPEEKPRAWLRRG
eukprot:2972871-Rhodomonas_salina.2